MAKKNCLSANKADRLSRERSRLSDLLTIILECTMANATWRVSSDYNVVVFAVVVFVDIGPIVVNPIVLVAIVIPITVIVILVVVIILVVCLCHCRCCRHCGHRR